MILLQCSLNNAMTTISDPQNIQYRKKNDEMILKQLQPTVSQDWFLKNLNILTVTLQTTLLVGL